MNDMFLIGCAAAVAVCFILAYLATFSTAASLCEAKIGQVYDFEYLQPLNGERKRWKARVVEPVSHFSNARLEQMNRSSNYRRDDKDFKRTTVRNPLRFSPWCVSQPRRLFSIAGGGVFFWHKKFELFPL